jgi:microcystin-dependent protein
MACPGPRHEPGNGIQNFALPNSRGRIALSVSSTYAQGEIPGSKSVMLLGQQMPAHNDFINATANGTANALNTPGPTVIPGSGTSTQQDKPPVNLRLMPGYAATDVGRRPPPGL